MSSRGFLTPFFETSPRVIFIIMGHKPRIDYPGAFHHITARGYDQEYILDSAADRDRFVEDLAAISVSHNLIIYAFCVMSNHIHIYAETPEGNLSEAMQHLLNRYKCYYNAKIGKKEGNVFGKRFYSVVVESEIYAQYLMRYIHMNPVGLTVNRPEDWIHSSAADYLVGTQQYNFVQKDLVLQDLSKRHNNPSQYLRDFHNAEDATDWDPSDYIIGKSILGSTDFFRRIEPLLPETVREFYPIQALKMELKVPQIIAMVEDLKLTKPIEAKIFALKSKTAMLTDQINDRLDLRYSKQRMYRIVAKMKRLIAKGDAEAIRLMNALESV